jgi:hypothetical protein
MVISNEPLVRTVNKMIKWTLKMDSNNDHFVWPLVARHPKRIKCKLKMNLSNVHKKCTAIMYTKTVPNICLLLNYSHKCSLYKTIF